MTIMWLGHLSFHFEKAQTLANSSNIKDFHHCAKKLDNMKKFPIKDDNSSKKDKHRLSSCNSSLTKASFKIKILANRILKLRKDKNYGTTQIFQSIVNNLSNNDLQELIFFISHLEPKGDPETIQWVKEELSNKISSLENQHRKV